MSNRHYNKPKQIVSGAKKSKKRAKSKWITKSGETLEAVRKYGRYVNHYDM